MKPISYRSINYIPYPVNVLELFSQNIGQQLLQCSTT